MEKKIPAGVKALAVLFIVAGAMNLYFYVFFSVSQPHLTITVQDSYLPENTVQMYNAVVQLPIIDKMFKGFGVLGCGYLLLGIGLFKLNNLARIATIILQVLLIPAAAIVSHLSIKHLAAVVYKYSSIDNEMEIILHVLPIIGPIFNEIVILVVSGVIIYYLTRSEVKEQFK